MSESVLITGGFGNLGSWMVEHFLNKQYKVFVLTRKPFESHYQVETIIADISDIGSLNVLANYQFNHVIHLASFNEFFEDNYFIKALNINVLGTYNLIQKINTKEIKTFIYFSTYHVYGDLDGLIDEISFVNPSNDYAQTHYFAEKIVKQYCEKFDIPFSIFRLTNSYGCPKLSNNNKWYLVINDLCRQAFYNKKIVLKSNGNLFRDFIWMNDVCVITETFLKQNLSSNEIYNLSSGNLIKILDLAIQIKEYFSKKCNQEIELLLNENDKNSYPKIKISNEKLKSLIQFPFENKILFEIKKIFKYLEENQ